MAIDLFNKNKKEEVPSKKNEGTKITLKKALKEQEKEKRINPVWLAPLMVGLMVLGLVWIVVFYITASTTSTGFPIPDIGNWNLLIGLGFIFVGFLLTTFWK